MKFERFVKILENADKNIDTANKLRDCGIDIVEIELWQRMEANTEMLFEDYYGEEGYEMILWFMWDKDFGRNSDTRQYDDEGREICNTVMKLWEWLEEKKSANNLEFKKI